MLVNHVSSISLLKRNLCQTQVVGRFCALDVFPSYVFSLCPPPELCLIIVRTWVKMEDVVTDSVPSPPRSVHETVVKPENEHRPKYTPDTTLPSAHPYHGSNPDKINSGASQSAEKSPTHDSKTNSKDFPRGYSKVPKGGNSKGRVNNYINIQNAQNIVIGNVKNIFPSPNPCHERQDKKKENNDLTLSDDDRKKLKELRDSSKSVTQKDLIIVSECLTLDGIKILAKKLEIKKQIFNQLQITYGHELSELCFQVLQHWTDLCKERPGNLPMLNFLSIQLVDVLAEGGDEALRSLHRHNYDSS